MDLQGLNFKEKVFLREKKRLKKPFAALKKIGYSQYMALECGILGNPEEELPKCVSYLRSQM